MERLRRRDPAQTEIFVAWLAQLQQEFADRALPITAAIAEGWGGISSPGPLPVIDALLAATAKVHGMTLVTRNSKDVARTGATTLNPFT